MMDAGGAHPAAVDPWTGRGTLLVCRGGAVADVANYAELRRVLEAAGASKQQVSQFAALLRSTTLPADVTNLTSAELKTVKKVGKKKTAPPAPPPLQAPRGSSRNKRPAGEVGGATVKRAAVGDRAKQLTNNSSTA